MIVIPSWTRLWTAQMAEEQLSAFKFKGPGIYITATETMLVVPMSDSEDPWIWFHGQHYHFHTFDGDLSKTILAYCTGIPIRENLPAAAIASVHAELSRSDSALD